MQSESALTDRIIEAVAKAPDCRIEELVCHFPDLTWSQVFRELDHLSRKGQLRLMVDDRGVTVRRPGEVMPLER
jgi:hypothetical protein